jgi:hypothetical protein
MGPPELIFPTRRTRAGNNQIEKDALVRLPSADDMPPWFEIAGGTAAGYAGEVFTAIFLPKALDGFVLPEDHVALGTAQFEIWQKAWQRPAVLVPGTGATNPITEAEARAHKSPVWVVQTSDAPAPQLIYRVNPGTDGALWVNFHLGVEH